ncbi:AAA family ATPase [Candidatus Chloroploca sp. M-50]|uniref:AAA family ATPase n=1 Tax=Candidatus Chloroploca mongolica TaxID=2528176 RepID=A0ABS4DDE7_9CHLR|nr:AAA family ATPase [Candidatus Chloroploca mongolica]MBP1467460.1 AAA family ATPase [Candidatus Chloroploca mongolica]
MRRGLTLGKFAPFHRGHQMLIETALSEVDELVVMVYATDVINVPLQVRAGWIHALYPTLRIIEAWDGPSGYGTTPEIVREQENYILKKLNGLRITHFYSSEFYGDHVSQALGAIDRRIDEARLTVPISGTALREDYFAGRQYLDPLVYADLITKVCFLGAPSTGKTTLASTMAEQHKTVWMPEYGADYWREHQVDRRITLEQFEAIAPEHNSREDTLTRQSRTYLFCDTNPMTTYVFAKDYHGTAGPVLTRLAKEAEKRYDVFFLCDTDIPYADTWDRSGDQKRKWFQDQIVGDLAERQVPFFRVRGTLEERVAQVNDVLRRHRKFGNVLDI